MTALVDTKPALITPGNVASNIAVRSQTWADVAQVLNMARGYGAMLVAPHFIRESIPTQTAYTYRYYTTPTLTDCIRVWILNAYSAAPVVQVTPTYSAGIQTAIPSSFGQPPVLIADLYTGGALTAQEATLTVEASAAATVTVDSIALVEIPRSALSTAELGIITNVLRIGDPIFFGSYSPVGASVNNVMRTSRRVSQAHWFRVNGDTLSSTTFASAVISAIPALNRRFAVGETSRSISVRAYASAVTHPGEVRFTGTKAASAVTLAVPVGAAAWTATGQILIDSELAASVNGLRGGTFDTISVQFRTTAVGGTVNLFGYSIWEDVNDVP